MINGKKYEKEILEIARNGETVAVIDGKVTGCGLDTECDHCLFNNEFEPCKNRLKEWFDSDESLSKQDKDYIKKNSKLL